MIKHRQELNEVLQRVRHWPPELRLRLARRLLESIDTGDAASVSAPRGLNAADAIAAVSSQQPAPTDETVERWIAERRGEKYCP